MSSLLPRAHTYPRTQIAPPRPSKPLETPQNPSKPLETPPLTQPSTCFRKFARAVLVGDSSSSSPTMLQAAAQRVQSSAKWRDMFIIATVTPRRT